MIFYTYLNECVLLTIEDRTVTFNKVIWFLIDSSHYIYVTLVPKIPNVKGVVVLVISIKIIYRM